MTTERTVDSGRTEVAAPTVIPRVSIAEKEELLTYVVRSRPSFRYARERLSASFFDEAEDGYLDRLWSILSRLADRHGDGGLPHGLRRMLETEVQAEIATSPTPEAIANPLLGIPTQMGRNDERQGGLIARAFTLSQEEVDSCESRARELVDRIEHEYEVARTITDFADQCGDNVASRESIDDLLCRVQQRRDARHSHSGRLQLIDSQSFAAQELANNWLIENILIAGQPALIGGMKKTLKTSIVIDLAVSLGIGPSARFLNRFTVDRQQRVGVFSGESGAATLQETFRRVCRSKSREPEHCAVNWCFELPQLSAATDLRLIGRRICDLELSVVVIDPIYLSLLGSGSQASPANLFDVGPLLKAIADVCLEAGATPILVHHNTKNRGNQRGNGVPQLEDLAFAGFQEFARQWLLVGRREVYVPGTGEHRLWLNVGGSVGFSGCYGVDINEGVVGNDFSGRTWRVLVRTEARQLEEDSRRQGTARDERELSRRRRDEEALMRALRRYPDGETLAVLRDAARTGSRTRSCLNELVDRGRVAECRIQKRSGASGMRAYDGFRLAPVSQISVPPVADPAGERVEIPDNSAE